MKDKNIDIEEDDASELQRCLLAECDRIYREICKQKGISFDDLLGEMVDGVGFTGIVVPEVEDFTCQLEQNIRKHIRNYAMKQIESINPDAFKYADGISPLHVMADLNTGKPTDTWISLYGSKAS